MGLFDIFRRHKKKEEEKTPDSSSAVVQSETAHEDESADTTSAAPASAPIHPEPVNIPPADSYEEKINPDGTRETLHNEVKEEQEQQPSPEPEEDQETETVKKYDRGLEKSRTGFGARLNKFLANFRHVDEDFFDDLEDMLIESDVGYDMAMKLSDELREEVKLQNAKSKQDVSNVIIEKMVELYDEAGQDENPDLTMAKEGPTVIMFVGVNGAGKTTLFRLIMGIDTPL